MAGEKDAGTVKATVKVVYDDQGFDQGKQALANVPETLSGLEQGAGDANTALASLDAQMVKNAESARNFGSQVGALEKSQQGGEQAITSVTEALGEQQPVIENTGAAYEALQKPIEGTTRLLEEAAPQMQLLSKNAESMQTQISAAGDGFTQIQASLTQTMPLLPQFAESMHSVSESFDPKAFGLDTFAENMSVFQDALVNPEPFNLVQGYLGETGQTWQDFASSIGSDNAAMLDGMKQSGSVTHDVIGGMAADFQSAGSAINESHGQYQAFTEQFNGMAESATNANKAINEFGGVGKALYGPELPFGGVGEVASLGDIFGGAVGGLNDMLTQIAMPLMAVQMIGMAVQAVGQSIYDSAAIAEGPAAHSFGTFTGTVDALGQSTQRLGEQFSESFGQQLLPMLNAMNYQASQANGGGLGGFVGGLVSTVANLWQLGTGTNVTGGLEGFSNQVASWIGAPQPFQGPGPTSQYQQQMAQLPQAVQAATQQLQYQSSLTLAEAVNPTWLAANDKVTASQQAAQYLIQSYDRSHPQSQYDLIQQARYDQYAAQQTALYNAPRPSVGQTIGGDISAGNWGQAWQDFTSGVGGQWGQEWQSQGGAFNSIGDFFSAWGNNFIHGGETPYQSMGNASTRSGWSPSGGIDFGGIGQFFGGIGSGVGNFFGGLGQDWNNLWNGEQQYQQDHGYYSSTDFGGGCFIAGTHVLMADGAEKAIETLQPGEQVLAHDGERQIATPIRAFIQLPPRRVYKLTFSDGNTLTLTDSHPIATPLQGWKAISPKAAKKENPALTTTALKAGDVLCTAEGTCTLTSIHPLQGMRPVFNIEVGAPHTFYANGVLAHNKMMGGGPSSMTNSGVGSEQVSLSHTFTANVTWAANNLEKAFTGVASWVGQGLANTFNGVASWVGQGLANTFNGVASWIGSGLANTFNGIASWVGSGLANTFNGIASWVGSGLANTFQGVANWVGSGLENTFKGVASWAAQGLEHTFNAVANWTAQNLTPNFMVNPQFSMLADGTSNWSGGPAIVGEAGPEVVEHNGHYSLFDEGATLLNLPSGANVYPMKNMASSSVAQFADGTGNNIIPLPIGLKDQSANAPQSMNIYLQIDGQTFWSATGVSLAQTVRAGSGMRSY